MRVRLAISTAALLLSYGAPEPTALTYTCTERGATEKQTVTLDVELTVPATAAIDVPLT
ncbi:hypothetical protein HII36_55350, partial [Nonomuraea sp. NN258]|nr:hypothetical protein [Nonomuraea antri]